MNRAACEPDQTKLLGRDIRDFRNALFAAYPSPEALAAMLQFGLNESLARISTATDMYTMIRAVINTAETEGWSLELLVAARTFNPQNPELVKFAGQFGLSPAVFEQTGDGAGSSDARSLRCKWRGSSSNPMA